MSARWALLSSIAFGLTVWQLLSTVATCAVTLWVPLAVVTGLAAGSSTAHAWSVALVVAFLVVLLRLPVIISKFMTLPGTFMHRISQWYRPSLFSGTSAFLIAAGVGRCIRGPRRRNVHASGVLCVMCVRPALPPFHSRYYCVQGLARCTHRCPSSSASCCPRCTVSLSGFTSHPRYSHYCSSQECCRLTRKPSLT